MFRVAEVAYTSFIRNSYAVLEEVVNGGREEVVEFGSSDDVGDATVNTHGRSAAEEESTD